jgi:hypothetical protein
LNRIKTVLIATMLFALLAPHPAVADDMPSSIWISAESVNIRADPSTGAETTGRFSGGEIGTAIQKRQGADPYPWYLVVSRKFWPRGPVVEGWVYGQFVSLLDPENWDGRAAEIMHENFAEFMKDSEEWFGPSPEEAIKRLGKPDSMTEKEEQGIHNPTDRVTWSTLSYQGLELAFFATNTGNGGLISAKITTEDHALGSSIRPGAALRDVILEAGPPHMKDGEALLWEDDAGYADLRVTFSGGRATEVDFTVFVD